MTVIFKGSRVNGMSAACSAITYQQLLESRKVVSNYTLVPIDKYTMLTEEVFLREMKKLGKAK